MSILPRLLAAYRNAGYEPLTGYNPYHFGDYMDAPFTRFAHEGQLVGMAGLALQEIMFVEGLREYLKPKSILVIGNAHGWSTIALGLTFPNAAIVAVDPNQVGNDLTNRIAADCGLNIKATTGFSPADVPAVIRDGFGPQIDLCLIDAVHDNPHLTADLGVVKPLLSPQGVVLMHDVINWNMIAALKNFLAVDGINGRLLTRTASGMAVAWQGAPSDDFIAYVEAFADAPELFNAYRKVILQNPGRSAAQALLEFT